MPFRDDLLNPIPGDNPSGVNLRYDAVTDKVKEARREEQELPQGQWKTAFKVADYGQVIKLASEVLATKGKDLQLAVWLVEAHIRREGFAALAPGFHFLAALLDQFWDTLYPEIEDDDLEVRSAVLEWLGRNLPVPIRMLPVTANRLSFIQYGESRKVGYENEADTSEKKALRTAAIEEGKITPEDFDQAITDTPKEFCEAIAASLEAATTELQALTEFCDSKFGDVSPSFVKTAEAIDEVARLVRGWITKKGGPSQPAAAPQPETVAVPAGSSGTAAAVTLAPVAQTGDGVEPSSLEDAAVRLAAIARYLRTQDAYAIGPYLMLRGLRWGEIRYNGPQIDATMLEAPPPELRKELKLAAAASNWDQVLELAETAMEQPCGRGWLDVQRYAVKALENKGEWFQYVAGAVRTELRGLLTDLPGLMEMSLMDDTPAANPETLAWIRQEVMPAVDTNAVATFTPEPEPVAAEAPIEIAAEPPSMESSNGSMPEEEPDVFDLAIQAARRGQVADAIQMLSVELDRERSGRGRFKRRMQLAHIFMASGHEKVAYPILEALADEIDRRGLEDWETGEVLSYPLVLLLKCLAAFQGSDEKRHEIYARICRLHPEDALNCSE